MIRLNPLTDLDRLTGRKCATCTYDHVEHGIRVLTQRSKQCLTCFSTGWAVEPIAAERCIACGGSGEHPDATCNEVCEDRSAKCPTCSGTGERYPDVLFTVDVFDDKDVLDYLQLHNRSHKPLTQIHAHIFAAIAAYGGRVFLCVKTVDSARAFEEWMNDKRLLVKAQWAGQIAAHPNHWPGWPLPNLIPVAVLGRGCNRCGATGALAWFPDGRVFQGCVTCNDTGTIPATLAEADALIAAVKKIPAAQHAVHIIGIKLMVDIEPWFKSYEGMGKGWQGLDILLVDQHELGSVGVATPSTSFLGNGDAPIAGTEPDVVPPTGEASLTQQAGEKHAVDTVASPVVSLLDEIVQQACAAGVEVIDERDQILNRVH